ncbi:MAG: MFS transporter [Vallitaleaceae bacterium]|nr:MFS transporter [Vallitaleaceae bacterium]
MITVLLLILIYLAFISLGLPDSLLGVSWPQMRVEWGLPLDAAGYISVAIVIATILSALLSGHIIKRLGTGKVTFLSCLITGSAIVGFSFAPSYFWLILLAFPLGFGAGSVDTALNNYVALHFKAHHMNWLHSFWGVGATVGPLIMANALGGGLSWRSGYLRVGMIQLVLAFLLLVSLPLWKKHSKLSPTAPHIDAQNMEKTPAKRPLKIKGVPYALASFVFYCAAEASVGLWGSSYLVEVKGLAISLAATYIAMYFGGITIGRFLCGFLSFKFNNVQMIRGGIAIALLSAFSLLFPIPNAIIIIPLMLFGIGLAPIFPAMIHSTPTRFGSENSQFIIGYQMASAYTGVALFAPLLGVALKNIDMRLFPYFLWVAVLILLICSERVLRITRK